MLIRRFFGSTTSLSKKMAKQTSTNSWGSLRNTSSIAILGVQGIGLASRLFCPRFKGRGI